MLHTENSLWQVLFPIIRTAVATFSGPPVAVVRAFEPGVQHHDGQSSLALYRVASRRYGAQGVQQEWRVDADGHGRMIETAIWRKEDTYRAYASVERLPEDGGTTAKDLLEAVAATLQGQEGIAALRTAGLGILRMTDIVETPFLTDQERHTTGHHIDFILTYRQEREREIPVTTRIERKVYRV